MLHGAMWSKRGFCGYFWRGFFGVDLSQPDYMPLPLLYKTRLCITTTLWRSVQALHEMSVLCMTPLYLKHNP